MARRDRDYRTLLVDTLDSIRQLYASNDVNSDIEARNKVIHTVNFLEDVLYPYMNHDKYTQYTPPTSGDVHKDLHYRIRELVRIAREVALMPPEEVIEDASEFTLPDT